MRHCGASSENRSRIALCLALIAIAGVCVLELQEELPVEHSLMSALQNKAGSISSVLPAKGPYHGKSVVTITGPQLSSGGINDIAKITVNGIAVDKVLSTTPNKIVARTASMKGSERMPGTGDVVVVSHSKGRTVGKHMYEYKQAPLVFAVEPDNGAHIGGTTINIKGQHLCSANEKLHVQVCDKPAKNVQCMGHYVKVTTSAFNSARSNGGACDVVVRSKVYGHTTAHRAFTYRPAPMITHITPHEGPYEGGNKIRIFGSELTSGKGRLSEDVLVKVDGKFADVLDYTPSNVLVEVPRGLAVTGFVDIEVISKRHGTSSMGGMYRMHRKPVIQHLSAWSGRANGGEQLTLYGEGLGRGDIESVLIGEHKASVLWADRHGRKIKVLTPKFQKHDEHKTLHVTVKSRLRGHARIQGFKVYPRGTIFSISPKTGPAMGGTLVTIHGKNLGAELEDFALVKVNDVPATIMDVSPEKVVVKTHRAAPGVDGKIRIYSRRHGITTSPMSIRFKYSKTPQLTAVHPAMSDKQGGEQVVLTGERLCNTACSDLEHIQVGNAIVKHFTSKSAKRIVFHAPTAEEAGGAGPKTITVRSKSFGDAESPEGFLYLEAGSAGTVWPLDAPMHGQNTVFIEGANLGAAEEYRVMLAGVEAKVLSASSKKIEVQVGDAAQYSVANKLDMSEGLRGNIIIETMLQGKASGMDTQVQFRYNPECSIERVESSPGPADGDKTLLISGQYLGMGDEQIYINGKPTESGFTVRSRQGANVHELSLRASSADGEPNEIVLKSARTGTCKWSHTAASAAARY